MEHGYYGPSSSFCSAITIPERFPRRAQQREQASAAVLRTLTCRRYKRRLSSDFGVGASQPQLKTARSALFDGTEAVEDGGSSASCIGTARRARPSPSSRLRVESREDEVAQFSATDMHQYLDMDVDIVDARGDRSRSFDATV